MTARSGSWGLLLPILVGALLLLPVEAGDRVDPSTRGETFSADAELPLYDSASPRSGGQVTGQSVIGADDRVRINDTHVYPWRAIAWLGLYDEFGEFVGSCSGTFVSRDAVLTAGHCLYNEGQWVQDIVVVPGKDANFDPYGHEFAASWWVPDQWILTGGDPDWDWGIIRMPNGNLGATVGWFTVANLLSPTLERVDLVPAMVGYPGDVSPPGSMWAGIKQQFVDVEPFTLFHDIDTFPGQSGSAVFVGDLDSPLLGFIVGIHTSGLGSVNAASRIDEELLSDLQLGCAEMGCSLESFTEPAASFHQITNARACVSTPLCQGGPETLVTGKQAWAAFGISPLPSKMLEGELFWKGEFLKQVAWPAPPYGPGGFNLDNNVLGKPATPGFFELRLWVGGLYVGAITMEVKPASASPPPNPVLLHRKRFGAIARD